VAAVFILTTVLFLFIFLLMGITSQLKKARHTFLYFSLAAVSLFFLLIILFFSAGFSQEAFSASHTGKHISATILKEIPDPEPLNQPPADDHANEENPPGDDKGTPHGGKSKIEVQAGQIVEYLVEKGDGLWSIASRSGVTVDRLKQWNNLRSDVIYVGQTIKIYGEGTSPPPASPVSEPPQQSYSKSILLSNGSLKKKQIALTFDAGSDTAGIGILDVLETHNVKATFFLTGKWAENFPDLAKKIVTAGHNIGNHTYSHLDALKVSTAAFQDDIAKAEEAILSATGKSPRPYFRFPYGSYNEQALKIAGEAGYKYSIHWTIDTIDWKQPSVEEIVNRIKSQASSGDIILMHIGGINTPKAVDTVIPFLKAEGYQLVTLDELLR
jgi:peptidoglycan/xylan/chitin deacetylase (PgdA/CDA1 family)